MAEKSPTPTSRTDRAGNATKSIPDGPSAWEAAQEKGYLGPNTDSTPDEHYTIAGVTSNKPTPETVEPGSKGSTKAPLSPAPDGGIGGSEKPKE